VGRSANLQAELKAAGPGEKAGIAAQIRDVLHQIAELKHESEVLGCSPLR
jgi:hypothetical protein